MNFQNISVCRRNNLRRFVNEYKLYFLLLSIGKNYDNDITFHLRVRLPAKEKPICFFFSDYSLHSDGQTP